MTALPKYQISGGYCYKMKTFLFQSKVLFLGFLNIKCDKFTFSNLSHARLSKDLILGSVNLWMRPFCVVKLIPVLKRKG